MRKGYTLIELLVVIAIIGILSTLAVVALNNARAVVAINNARCKKDPSLEFCKKEQVKEVEDTCKYKKEVAEVDWDNNIVTFTDKTGIRFYIGFTNSKKNVPVPVVGGMWCAD